jgi:predicted exporter
MKVRRARALLVWVACIIVAAIVVIRARYITDLSAFLPDKPTPTQQLLVDQLRDGPASRLILIAIEGADPAERARLSRALAASLRRDPRFVRVDNGEPVTEQADREFLFKHRYLLSDAVSAERFSAAGLHAAIAETIDDLASPTGLLFKSLLPRDPTGELLHVIDQLSATRGPQTRDGVWVSPAGNRALAVAQTRALGSDSDAQEQAVTAIRAAFAAAEGAAAAGQSTPVGGAPSGAASLKLSGPGVFAVAARAKIESAALRLSLISSALVVTLLLAVYRSLPALGLGLLPVGSGALVGIAAVALGFGAVHGITLGFGITLIGESVDYSIYFFIQSRRLLENRGEDSWQRRWWPTVRLGMLTSVCGFASLLPSGFPGLQQLGLYSISGLITAALVTRFVLPALLRNDFAVHDVTPIGTVIAAVLAPVARLRRGVVTAAALLLALLAAFILIAHRDSLWNRQLSALSPVPLEEQNFDAELRAELGAADVRDLIVISGPDLESVLRDAELAGRALQPLLDAKVIGSIDSPATFLPSMAAQDARRDSLPGAAQLRDNLRQAAAGLAIGQEKLQPFLEDVEATRHGALLTARDLRGTSLNTGFESMILHQRERWNALLPLHAAEAGQEIDLAPVATALQHAHLNQARVLDLKRESDKLYADYLNEAIRLSLAGFAAVAVLLLVTLRSARRVVLVLSPLILSVLVVAAGLALWGVQLTILHLVGMLLIVAVGSNYALFFDRERHAGERGAREPGSQPFGSHQPGSQPPGSQPLMLASLCIANASTVIGFGLLSFSGVPVLMALGCSVAPGAFLALLFSALLERGATDA